MVENAGVSLRSEVREFAKIMEAALRQHDAMRGDSWKHMDTGWLLERLRDEVEELRQALRRPIRHFSLSGVAKEAADVANFAMFIWAIISPGRLDPEPVEIRRPVGEPIDSTSALQPLGTEGERDE